MEVEGTKAQVKGKPHCEDLVENPSSASSTAASGTKTEVGGAKRPCVDHALDSSAAATAVFGTKTEVEGAKRPCVDHALDSSSAATAVFVTDETEEKEEEIEEEEEEEVEDDDEGCLLRFEGNQLIPIERRPKLAKIKMGPPLPHPNALTYERFRRRVAETKIGFLRGDDPLGVVPWKYSSPTPAASTSGLEARSPLLKITRN
ncbi:hypothetical protein L1987_50033 [Smallanthus sonchifolius]|uniref:Uncharacterized protein n=1 Tax=Smallanthus sonchifolius TaxID=185202 RepID=A0ACB9FW43_9ASTR|nr:hypothetical protein L1987_50033 [Smallanthus sonchifolius]